MNLVYGKEFHDLRNKARNVYKAYDLVYSTRRRDNKKYVVVVEGGRQIHFGHPQYQDFVIHKDKDRRIIQQVMR